jgi:hypothetical protein
VNAGLASWIQAAGALLAGLAAALGAINRWHIQKLRGEVNGQTHALVETTHALGIVEGVHLEHSNPTVDKVPPTP